MKGCQTGLIFSMVICMINASPYAARKAQKGVLSNVVLAQEEFQGEYNIPGTDKGIQFSSKATPSRIEMHIASSMSEYPILTAIRSMPHSNHDVTIMSINSTDFMIVKNQESVAQAASKYDDYIIPNEATRGRMMAMIESAGVKNHDTLNLLHREGIEETRQSVFHALAMSDEGKLIVQAAQALGYDHNIQGRDHPSVMKFYQMARNLAEIQSREDAKNGKFDRTEADRARQQVDIQEEEGVQCESIDTKCASEELCPYPMPEYENDCYGLCGYGCNCWLFVCGDCCIHEYCLSHDYCCSIDYWSWGCIFTPFTSMTMGCEDTVEC